MSSNRPPESLTKTTLNLYSTDVEAFRTRYGFGWTEQIRNVVHENVKDWTRAKRVVDLINEEDK